MVYRAVDTRLEREVAVKVLPAGLLSDEAARTRFRQEALTLSKLNHPHIAVVHDFDSAGGVDFLVMELLEGETLATRLQKGPLPLETMLRHAIEIASALDRAHRNGIVHRDLKPGNIMLTPHGAKLLDFGLAKMRGPETGRGASSLSSLATELRELTAEGTILGTFQYMAPEQLEGKPADARTDLFALGAVLYEMSTGHKAFDGKSQASLIASIMAADPQPISKLQPMTPPAMERLVRTCLAKSPDERWQTAHDVKLQLQWIAEGGSQVGLPAPVTARRRGRERWAWLLSALLAVVAVALAVVQWRREVPEVRAVRSFILAPEGKSFDILRDRSGGLSVSPDGRHLTFSVRDAGGDDSLWIRSLDSLSARALPGTKGAAWPFWSPDSRYIAFFSEGKLKKIDLAGSPPVRICDANDGRSGSWSRDGVIVFAPTSIAPIHRVPAAGGKATPVSRLDEEHGETTHRWATFLPDGKHFLYMAGTHSAGTKSETNAIYVAEMGSDRKKLLLQARSNVSYASGHLLYVRDRVLLAQPFDPVGLELKGEPLPLGDGVDYDPAYFRAIFAVSDNGVLAYQAGGAESSAQLSWLDRNGKEIEKVGEPGNYDDLTLSPDGRRFVFSLTDPDMGTTDLWIQDLARNVRTRFTFGIANDFSPVWSPDGARIAYAVSGKYDDLFVKPSSGGTEEVLFRSQEDKVPTDWSRDGKLLVFETSDPDGKTRRNIAVLSLSGKAESRPFLATEFNEGQGQLSPDGRWMLYVSDEAGRNEVYAAPYPGPGGKWQISSGGGAGASWRKGGAEIIYIAASGAVMSVNVRLQGANFETDTPRALFSARPAVSGDTTADAQRFLVALRPEAEQGLPITLVTNWTVGLDR